LLPATIAKADIVFSVSVSGCVIKPKSAYGDVSRAVDHHISGCERFGRCLFNFS